MDLTKKYTALILMLAGTTLYAEKDGASNTTQLDDSPDTDENKILEIMKKFLRNPKTRKQILIDLSEYSNLFYYYDNLEWELTEDLKQTTVVDRCKNINEIIQKTSDNCLKAMGDCLMRLANERNNSKSWSNEILYIKLIIRLYIATIQAYNNCAKLGIIRMPLIAIEAMKNINSRLIDYFKSVNKIADLKDDIVQVYTIESPYDLELKGELRNIFDDYYKLLVCGDGLKELATNRASKLTDKKLDREYIQLLISKEKENYVDYIVHCITGDLDLRELLIKLICQTDTTSERERIETYQKYEMCKWTNHEINTEFDRYLDAIFKAKKKLRDRKSEIDHLTYINAMQKYISYRTNLSPEVETKRSELLKSIFTYCGYVEQGYPRYVLELNKLIKQYEELLWYGVV